MMGWRASYKEWTCSTHDLALVITLKVALSGIEIVKGTKRYTSVFWLRLDLWKSFVLRQVQGKQSYIGISVVFITALLAFLICRN